MKNKYLIKIDLYLDEGRDDSIKKLIEPIIDEVLKDLKAENDFRVKIGIDTNEDNVNLQKFSHITFFEISKRNPCFLFSSGYLRAQGATIELLSENNKDIRSIEEMGQIVFFENLEAYIRNDVFKNLLKKVLKQEINDFYKFGKFLSKIWFRYNQKYIYVIGGPDIEKTVPESTASEKLNDAIYNYGDKDTFIDCCIFLSKYLQNPDLRRHTSTEFEDGNPTIYNKNLVIIGGPGTEQDKGNHLCSYMMKKRKSRISYGFQGEERTGYYFMKVRAETYQAITDETNNDIIRDYGYFACFNNPDSERSRVILINGIHTAGVLGAFKAFSDAQEATRNYKTLLDKIIKSKQYEKLNNEDEMLEFECFFEVDVEIDETANQRNVKVPLIKPENIFFFDEDVKKLESKPNNNIPNFERLKGHGSK